MSAELRIEIAGIDSILTRDAIENYNSDNYLSEKMVV